MSLRLRRLMQAAICVAVFALCSPTQAVRAAGYVFMPPSGWKAIAKPGHGIGMWVHPDSGSFHQNISIIAERARGSLDDYTNGGVQMLKAMLPDVQFGHVQHATVCGSHPSTYLTYAATLRGRLLIYEQMATIWNGVAYVATYTRLSSQPSLPEARDALTSLCGGSTAGASAPARYAGPPARAVATPAPTTNYTTAAPVGSVAPTITPRP